MAFKAERIVEKSLPNINGFTCPVANIKFIGRCPNLKCPANVSTRNTTGSGCFHEQKNNNGIMGVARFLVIKTSDAKNRYQQGLKKAEIFTNFYNWLINHRENNVVKSCPNCGIGNKHNQLCLNRKRCDRRKNLVQKCQQRFPFNVRTLNITAAEFWAAANNEISKSVLSDKRQKQTQKLQDKLGISK